MAYLERGVFSDPLRIDRDDAEAWRFVACEIEDALQARPKQKHGPSIAAMQLVDWFTRRAQPLPAFILGALAAALGLTKNLKRDSRAAIAGRGWTCEADVIATVRADMVRHQLQDVRRRLFDAACWFTDRSLPLPYAIWWALACCLGLGRDGDAYGLTEPTVSKLHHGIGKPDGFHAAARVVGEARAQGQPPLSLNALARTVTGAVTDADRRRMTPAKRIKADLRTDRKRLDKELFEGARETVREWMTRPEWGRLCRSYEITARANLRAKERSPFAV